MNILQGLNKTNSNNKGSFNPRGQSFSSPRPQFKQPENNVVQQKTVANVFTEEQSNMTMSYYPPPAVNTLSLDISKLSQEQVQVLSKQLTPQLRLPESAAPVSQSSSSISEKGVMAVNSSSGNVVTISSNLRYENHSLTFQHHCLTSLQNALPNGAWIIDSGATSHVCCDLSKFKEIHIVSGITVALPNGLRLPIQHTGTIHLSDSLILYDVLHVPAFHFSLISVSSLLKQNQCSAHFYPTFCYL